MDCDSEHCHLSFWKLTDISEDKEVFCSAEGNPKPIIHWQIPEGFRGFYTSKNNSDALHFPENLVKGTYKFNCDAQNEIARGFYHRKTTLYLTIEIFNGIKNLPLFSHLDFNEL